ncbi:unnamed protein product [Medioppia subpectinata]|uniref:Uncharacterized protein n=1 Tax=Medioppia subpectinata TaxID=1979941 RepID=A0A7R9KCM1_9ACAR|nr:unnamed protein product [Medioppia subpectinata]CAG2100174.1 unnamed protein product [Medioppia subpectinata]
MNLLFIHFMIDGINTCVVALHPNPHHNHNHCQCCPLRPPLTPSVNTLINGFSADSRLFGRTYVAVSSGSSRTAKPLNSYPKPYTLKTFLGCVPNVPNPPPNTNTVTNTMATIGSSSSSVSPQLNRGPESEGKTSSTTIVIVVTVILIVIIVLCAVIYFYIRRNANTETIAQRKKMSEKESKATDTETRLMSIETINSSTGFKDK